jgi:hypothetical protein
MKKGFEMTKVAIIRCEKNENRCPLTNCFVMEKREPMMSVSRRVFLRAVVRVIMPWSWLKYAKGAEAIHFCTCAFAKQSDQGWKMGVFAIIWTKSSRKSMIVSA